MTGKYLLLVSGIDGSSRAEVAVLDTAQETGRRIQSLLLAGFDPDRIRVFTGRETAVEVTHRPVVHLMKRNGSDERAGSIGQRDGQSEPELVPVGAIDAEPELAPVAAKSHNSRPAPERRFSDLFRRAYVA